MEKDACLLHKSWWHDNHHEMINKNGPLGDKCVTQLPVCHILYFWPDTTFHNSPIHNCRNQRQITFNQSENTKIKNAWDTHDHKMCDVKNAIPNIVDKIKGKIFHLHHGGK